MPPLAPEVALWQLSVFNVQTPVKFLSLRWRHNGRDSVSNHQPHDCLLNRLFRRRSKKISKLRVTGLCVGNSPGTGEIPAQMASYAENVSIWWRHHVDVVNQLVGRYRYATCSRYLAVSSLREIRKYTPWLAPWVMGCLLWIHCHDQTLAFFPAWCVKYHAIRPRSSENPQYYIGEMSISIWVKWCC